MLFKEIIPVIAESLAKPVNTKSRLHCRLHFTHDIEADLITLGLRGWRRKAFDRDEWGDVLEEAKARSGLCSAIDVGDDISHTSGLIHHTRFSPSGAIFSDAVSHMVQ
jgi:hypothetical protein